MICGISLMETEIELDLEGSGYNFRWLRMESGYQGNRKEFDVEKIALIEQYEARYIYFVKEDGFRYYKV